MIKINMMRNIVAILCLMFYGSIEGQQNTLVKNQLLPAIEDMRSFISLPNDANYSNDIDKNILWLMKEFSKRDFETKLVPTDGLPLFYAEMNAAEKNVPTMLIYMHFDGQPVDPSKWDQANPYQLALKEHDGSNWREIPWSNLKNEIDPDWRLFGRSTSDDKGPIVLFLHAMDMMKAAKKSLSYNIKVVLDPEEEKGSKHLPKAVALNRELFQADLLLISDGPVHASLLPTIVFGCRGITSMSLTTYGPIRPQHSGHFGNYAPNPALQLAQLLASMKDDDGKVVIDGFYDGIQMNQKLREVLAEVPDEREKMNATLGIMEPDKVGSTYQESIQYPSLNIRGMSSAWVGKEVRTIVPATAVAEIDVRLVVESDGDRLKELIRDHIRSRGFRITNEAPDVIDRRSDSRWILVKERGVMDAFRTDMDHPYGQWLTKILEDTFEEKVVRIRTMGGTVPIAPFVNTLEIPAFIVPLVNPDNNQHSPNENIRIAQVAYGLQAFYSILTSEPPKVH